MIIIKKCFEEVDGVSLLRACKQRDLSNIQNIPGLLFSFIVVFTLQNKFKRLNFIVLCCKFACIIDTYKFTILKTFFKSQIKRSADH